MAELQPVDLVVCGSVAVNREGARVGKGGGFSDLELALLVEAGLIGPETVVATTVHQTRDRFTDALKRRPDIVVVRVTQATRDALPEQLMGRLVGTPRGEQQ